MVDPTEFDDAQFDVDKFDADTDSTIGSDAQSDIEEILLEAGQWFHIIRLVETKDTQGKVTGVTEQTYNVYGYIETLTSDQMVEGMGLVAKGETRVFLKHKYTMDTGLASVFVPKEGDIVSLIENKETNDDENDGLETEDFKRWKIKKLVTRPAGFKTGFLIGYLVRIDNEGSRE